MEVVVLLRLSDWNMKSTWLPHSEVLFFSSLLKRTYVICAQMCKLCSILLIRPWDYSENFGIYSKLDRKSKHCSCIFLNVYVSWIERDKILISQLSPLNSGILQTKMGQRGYPMKMNFDKFQIQKWVSLTVRARKADEKMRSFVWFSCLLSQLWSLNCQKLCQKI